MKKITNLLKFQLQIYVRGSSFIMPLIVSIIFLYVMYTIMPLGIVSSFMVSCTFIFLLMVWIGLSAASGEEMVTEQILLLRVQSAFCYYVSKVLFLLFVTLFLTVVYIGFPLVQNLLNDNALFLRQITAFDVGNIFLLLTGCGFAGAALGSFLHPRVMKDRKMAIILTVFFSILSVVQMSVTTHVPMLKGIFWVLPPVMLPSEFYGNAEYFVWGQTVWMFLRLFLYGIAVIILKSIICHKNKF